MTKPAWRIRGGGPKAPAGRLLARLAALALVALWGAAAAGEKVYGYVERVRLHPAGLELRAKLDTGATTTSIHATDEEIFRRDGREWVRFSVESGGEEARLELPIERFARIKRHDGDHDRRPVVRVAICLDRELRHVEASLADRSRFLYPVLLGRNFLKDFAWVDVDQAYTDEPVCEHDDG